MSALMQGNTLLFMLVLVFVAVVLGVEALYLLWNAQHGRAAKRVRQRLRAFGAEPENGGASLRKQGQTSALPLLERLLEGRETVARLEDWIRQAGLTWTVSRLLLSAVLAGLVVALLLAVFLPIALWMRFAAALVAATAPFGWVEWRRQRRLARLGLQLPDALDLMARALRAGHAFPSSLQMVGDEMPDPIASEFRMVHDEINFGVPMQQALTNLTERVPNTDLRYFVVAVLVQRDSGGNLTEILGNLSQLIRQRLKLFARIRVLSSEGRLSAWVLALMPFGLGAIMNLLNPAFMSPLWNDPIGLQILKYTLILMAIGILILRSIVRIRV